MGKEITFRADAAFAKPEIYEALEERGVKHAIRIPSNDDFHCLILGLFAYHFSPRTKIVLTYL